MKQKNGLLLGAVLGAIGIMAQSATAAEIKVLTTGAFRQVVVALVPEFEKATGHKVVVDNGTVGQLQKRVDDGETFDVLVLSPKGIEDYIKGGKIAAGSEAKPSQAKPSSPRSASASWSRKARPSPTSPRWRRSSRRC